MYNEMVFERLSKSKFRSSFHLNKKMIDYVYEKGLDKVRNHAYDFVDKRLRPKYILNDGKQTPMRNVHPVFIAQHATGTCCRGCLYKWHGILKNKKLSDDEVRYIVDTIMHYIELELAFSKK